jgi:hypothetical protein
VCLAAADGVARPESTRSLVVSEQPRITAHST